MSYIYTQFKIAAKFTNIIQAITTDDIYLKTVLIGSTIFQVVHIIKNIINRRRVDLTIEPPVHLYRNSMDIRIITNRL